MIVPTQVDDLVHHIIANRNERYAAGGLVAKSFKAETVVSRHHHLELGSLAMP